MIIGRKYAGSLDKILENVETVSKYVGGRPLAIFMMKPGLEDMLKLTERLHENAIPLVSELSNDLNKLFKHCRIISIREYQDSDFFPDQLQTFIERCIGPQRFQM